MKTNQAKATLVGILNVTPDSFSDGGKFLDPAEAVRRAEELFAGGASVVDIGGEATNPWAQTITVAEEWRRLEPIVSALLPARPNFSYSIDTRHPEIIERAAKYGTFIVNDVTTFIDPAMIRVTARHGLKAIVSHLPLEARGDISLAHQEFRMKNAGEVRDELLLQKAKMIRGGIKPENIILDPGIGFGKSMPLNWELLKFAALLPHDSVMIGFSRKRFLSTDPISGAAVPGRDKTDPELNHKAARIAIDAALGRLWLRVHEPQLFT